MNVPARMHAIWPLIFAAMAMTGQAIAQILSGDLGDLPVFLGASERLQDGGSPYLTWIPTRNGNALQFVYPPIAAFLFYPFTWLTPPAAFMLWSVIRIALALRVLHLVLGIGPALSRSRLTVLRIVVLIVFLRFALDDIALGQWTIVILFLAVEGWHRAESRRTASGTFLIALGSAIKLLPMVLLFGFGMIRQWRALFRGIGLFTILSFGPMLIVGPQRMVELMHEWSLSLLPANNPDVSDRDVQGLSGLAHAFHHWRPFGGVPAEPEFDQWSAHPLAIALNVARLLLLLCAIIPASSKGPTRNTWLLSYLLLIAPLVLPHQQSYAFLFTLPACALLTRDHLMDFRRNGPLRSRSIALGIGIVLLCGTSHLLLGDHGYNIAKHARSVTLGALCLVPLILLGPSNCMHDLKERITA